MANGIYTSVFEADKRGAAPLIRRRGDTGGEVDKQALLLTKGKRRGGTIACKVTEHTLALLRYHEAHREMNYRRLGEVFGITKQRVSEIIKRDKRDRMVVEYLKTYPRASPAEVGTKFGIRSVWRVRVLMQEPEH